MSCRTTCGQSFWSTWWIHVQVEAFMNWFVCFNKKKKSFNCDLLNLHCLRIPACKISHNDWSHRNCYFRESNKIARTYVRPSVCLILIDIVRIYLHQKQMHQCNCQSYVTDSNWSILRITFSKHRTNSSRKSLTDSRLNWNTNEQQRIISSD